MPKVKESYFEDKKNTILDAAEKICMKKPLNKVTMKDIVRETKLSPGAVYASFSDIYEVIVALINRLNATVDFKNDVEKILQTANAPEEKIKNLLSYFIQLVYSSVDTYGKILFESTLFMSEIGPEQLGEIAKNIDEIQMYTYIQGVLFQVIDNNISSGYFKPAVSKETIYTLIAIFIDGLTRELTLVKSYKFKDLPMGITFEEKDLPQAITDSIIFLLNNQQD